MTREWLYDREAPRLRDRIKVKFNNEHALPVKLKALDEILNPQPEAQVVIHRLLDWMGRVDVATQTGARDRLSKRPTATTSSRTMMNRGG